jgi:hypothetical protein
MLEDLPPTRRHRPLSEKYEKALDLCRANPEKWVRVVEFDSASTAYSTKKQFAKAKIPGKWEFEARTIPKGDGTGATTGRFYARYMGGDGETS